MSRNSATAKGKLPEHLLRDLSAFYGLTSSLAGAKNAEQIAQLAASALLATLPCCLAAAATHTEGQKNAWGLVGAIDSAPLDDEAKESLASLLDMSLAVSEPIVEVPGSELPDSMRRHKVGLLRIFPIRTLKTFFGALLVGTSEAGPLSEDRRILLATLANEVAMALTNVRLRATLRDQNLGLEEQVRIRTLDLEQSEKEQAALLNIAQAVCAHLDREKLFGAVAETVRAVISFDRMGIVIDGPDHSTTVLYAFESTAGKPRRHQPGTELVRGGSVPGWVIENQRPFVAPTLKEISRFPQSLAALKKEGMQSCCALPLVVQGGAGGVLLFHSEKEGHFTPAQLPLLEKVSGVVALALDNCLAYEQIKQMKDQLEEENIYLQEEIQTEHNFGEIVGSSESLRKSLRRVEMVAPTNSSVLITGETGTGKEIIVRAIHSRSKRSNRPLIKVNCAALPSGLIESELFGHEKGAFTGALSQKVGRFELANGGTIFLDEIGDLPQDLQAKLLRVLQERQFERLGGTKTIDVDVRVIAATNREIEKSVADKSFRPDLYYRLNVFPISLPPLRERREDVPLLVHHFLKKYALQMDRPLKGISEATMRRLTNYSWPGNVRELQNLIERGVILSTGNTLEIEDELIASASSAAAPEEGDQPRSLEEVERGHIIKVLEQTGWVVQGPKGAAGILDMHPNTLRARMKKLGIRRSS